MPVGGVPLPKFHADTDDNVAVELKLTVTGLQPSVMSASRVTTGYSDIATVSPEFAVQLFPSRTNNATSEEPVVYVGQKSNVFPSV